MKIAVLISGRGTNLSAIHRASLSKDFPAEIALVISNKPSVGGITFAQDNDLPFQIIDNEDFENADAHEAAITEALHKARIDLVCLAGYMRVLHGVFTTQWRGKLVNIHPSLLPSFRGLDTHERALERGCRIHGCTVHYVTAELDGGPIIAQEAVPILPGDDADTLRERVLAAEHEIYPHAIRLIAEGKIRWGGDEPVRDRGIVAHDVVRFRATELSDPEATT
jgi:phosphoribosylglycinamide formyltransferase-1